jgi:hypothetical protein
MVQTSEQMNFAHYGASLLPKIGNAIINQHITCKGHVTSTVNQFIYEKFRGRRILGIHYRGTDKSVEAPRIPYEYVLDISKRYEDVNFFVATDETQFLDFMLSKYDNRVIYYDSIRSEVGKPIHLTQQGKVGYQIGKDALIDCLLLSSCDFLLRTESNLSQACTFFNPKLKVINLTDRYSKKARRFLYH